MEKVYFSVIVLIVTVLCFPIMQDAVNDANLSNAALDTFLVNFPMVLLVILTVIPISLYVEAKRK